jgi:hypothetical protein
VAWRTRSKPGGAARVPAAIQQQRASSIIEDAPLGLRIKWARVFSVAPIRVDGHPDQCIANVSNPRAPRGVATDRHGVWGAILVARPLRAPDWQVLPETFKGTICLLVLVSVRR